MNPCGCFKVSSISCVNNLDPLNLSIDFSLRTEFYFARLLENFLLVHWIENSSAVILNWAEKSTRAEYFVMGRIHFIHSKNVCKFF